MNNFEKYLILCAVEIKKEISSVLLNWTSTVENQTPALTDLNQIFVESFVGGKYIRGTLVKLGAEMAGVKNNDIIKVAAAFEILHTALLIHDDLIDKSAIRRGKSTVHTLLGNNHYGISQAICFGDIGLFLANKLIADSSINPAVKNKIISEFSQIILNTLLGEMLDVKTAYEKIKKEKDVMTINKLKTAYYTITGPLSVGSMLGKINHINFTAIETFGEYLGVAYQIQDDILGVFGDEKILGKSTTSDIKENKNTLLIAYALKQASPTQKHILRKYYGNKYASQKHYEQIKNIFVNTGALSYAEKKMANFVHKSKQYIPQITKNKLFQNYLQEFAAMIISRKR